MRWKRNAPSPAHFHFLRKASYADQAWPMKSFRGLSGQQWLRRNGIRGFTSRPDIWVTVFRGVAAMKQPVEYADQYTPGA